MPYILQIHKKVVPRDNQTLKDVSSILHDETYILFKFCNTFPYENVFINYFFQQIVPATFDVTLCDQSGSAMKRIKTLDLEIILKDCLQIFFTSLFIL